MVFQKAESSSGPSFRHSKQRERKTGHKIIIIRIKRDETQTQQMVNLDPIALRCKELDWCSINIPVPGAAAPTEGSLMNTSRRFVTTINSFLSHRKQILCSLLLNHAISSAQGTRQSAAVAGGELLIPPLPFTATSSPWSPSISQTQRQDNVPV